MYAIRSYYVAIEIAKRSPSVSVTAVDVSKNMLEVAKEKAIAAKVINRINFEEADAMHLPYDDNSFDIITISFALRNLADIKGGLKEMVRA